MKFINSLPLYMGLENYPSESSGQLFVKKTRIDKKMRTVEGIFERQGGIGAKKQECLN